MSMSLGRIAVVSAAIVSVGIASLGVTALAAPGTSGTTASATPNANQAKPSRSALAPAFQAAGTTAEMHYVPVTPCKLVDTRVAGGRFSSGTARSYHARGTGSLASQGGSSTGCELPQNAAVMASNVSAVTPAGDGYVQANASDAGSPGATVLNYVHNQSITTLAQIELAKPGSAFAFKVTNHGGPTQVVVTVVGYYIAPLIANIDTTGALISGSRVTTAREITGFPGQDEVIFDRDVTKCSYQASSFGQGLTAEVEPRSGNANGVFVLFTNSAGTVVRSRYYLTVTC